MIAIDVNLLEIEIVLFWPLIKSPLDPSGFSLTDRCSVFLTAAFYLNFLSSR